MKPDVVVAFATDHKFRYYTGVALHTLMEHSSPGTRYEILILADSLTSEDRAVFTRLVEGRANISLRILEMREKIAELGAENFYVETYPIAIYYRLFLHELLPEYDRVLYLDSDIVVQADVRELFDTDLGEFMLGAVKDYVTTRLTFFAYIRNTLKVRKPGKYFNSGVLLMDLGKLRNSEFSQRVRDELGSGISFKFPDQDILNRIFGDNICYMNAAWNCIIGSGNTAKHKKIIHFPGIKPWFSMLNPLGASWWAAAEKTFFVREMKEELLASPERVKYLENREISYYELWTSKCWRITAGLRLIFNLMKWSKNIFDGIVLGKGGEL